MFLLRSACANDLADIFKLSQNEIFINLPSDEEKLERIIDLSNQSFEGQNEKFEDNAFLFVIEDLSKRQVVGVSLIHSQHGTEEEPHFFLKIGQEHKFSQSINTGFIHGTLKLGIDTNGPTEIGGLVVDPEYRAANHKVGKQISFVRFLYMAKFPEKFREYVHSELLPPFTSDGKSPLWEAIGRRFLNMDYHEADILSRNNKEFILSLFPSENIYQTLLPMEARNAIGKVGESTLPVMKMLSSIGFKFSNEVDPFDGGPHFRCRLKDIKPIKQKWRGKIEFTDQLPNDVKATSWLIEIPPMSGYYFSAIRCLGVKRSDALLVEFPKSLQEYLDIPKNEDGLAIPF